MTQTNILELKKNRLQKLEANGKNIKSGGCLRKLKRQIRNMETEM